MNVYVLDVVWVDGDSWPQTGFLSVHSSRGGAERAATEHHRLNPEKHWAYCGSHPSAGHVSFQALGEQGPDLEKTDYVITEVELQP